MTGLTHTSESYQSDVKRWGVYHLSVCCWRIIPVPSCPTTALSGSCPSMILESGVFWWASIPLLHFQPAEIPPESPFYNFRVMFQKACCLFSFPSPTVSAYIFIWLSRISAICLCATLENGFYVNDAELEKEKRRKSFCIYRYRFSLFNEHTESSSRPTVKLE